MRSLLIVLALSLPALAQEEEDLPEEAPAEEEAGGGDAGEARRGEGPLAELLDPFVSAKGLGGIRLGVYVARADGQGKPLYTFQPDLPLHPASVTKLVTTAAALHALGPAHTFRTDLVTAGLEDGVADGLALIGGGDPFFVSESLWKLVDEAKDAGLQKVKGDITIDESYFGDEHLPPGYDQKPDDDAAYRASTGAASLNFNSIVVRLEPGAKAGAPVKVSTKPDTDYAVIDNEATTATDGKERLSLTAVPFKDRTKLIVRGRIPVNHKGITVRRRIDNPPLFTGLALRRALLDAGIKVTGKVKVAPAPAKRRLLARHTSPALGKLIDDVNKLSNNFMAEHCLRAIGAAKGGGGDFASSRRVVEKFLKEDVGLLDFTYANGSGLFGGTAFSTRQLGVLLQYMHTRKPALPEFAASLAIAGVDGTLWRRLKKLKPGVVRAKTGTLDGVVALSGYVDLGDGTPAVFSILANGVRGPWKVWKLQDEVLTALAGWKPE